MIRQQNLLTTAFFRVYLVCGFVSLMISLTGLNNMSSTDFSPENLMTTIFPRHLIFCGLIPTYLLGLLPAIQIRPQDILLYQSRKIVSLQVALSRLLHNAANGHHLGLRQYSRPFCQRLFEFFGRPLVAYFDSRSLPMDRGFSTWLDHCDACNRNQE